MSSTIQIFIDIIGILIVLYLDDMIVGGIIRIFEPTF